MGSFPETYNGPKISGVCLHGSKMIPAVSFGQLVLG